jgi:hypothetical protein
MGKAKPKPFLFTGRWRIVSMSVWEQDFVDAEEEGHIEFEKNNQGEFHFGCVHGHMSCRLTMRNGEPAVEWSWDGNDEMDSAHGRGWGVVKGDELHGMIFFHGGDESKFVAKKKGGKRPSDERG